jgi:HPt (histidine-containing phosphotransfer) domain-containing protein
MDSNRERYLEAAEAENTGHAPNLEARAQNTAASGAIAWEASRVLEILCGDKELLREVLEIFLEEGPKQIVALRRAITERSAIGVEKTAHSLKGELGILGISAVSRQVCELEEMGRTRDLRRAAEVFAAIENGISGVLITMRGLLAKV